MKTVNLKELVIPAFVRLRNGGIARIINMSEHPFSDNRYFISFENLDINLSFNADGSRNWHNHSIFDIVEVINVTQREGFVDVPLNLDDEILKEISVNFKDMNIENLKEAFEKSLEQINFIFYYRMMEENPPLRYEDTQCR